MTTIASIVWSVPKAIGLAYIPVFIRGFVLSRSGAKLDNTKPRDESVLSVVPDHIKDLAVRLKNCHNNQLETLGIFGAAVGIGLATKVDPESLSRLTGYYLKARLAYVSFYALPQYGNGILRSLSWMASMTSLMLIFAAAANTAS